MSQCNKDNFTEFKVASNGKKLLVYKCKHGVHRLSTSKGQRPHQHYNYLECKAQVNFYKSQVAGSSALKVSKLILEHSHTVNEEIYNLTNVDLEEEELNVIKDLTEAKTKPNQDVLNEKQG